MRGLRVPADICGGLEGPYRIYPEFLRPSRIPLTIVCGPPGGGKSTWVRTQARPADLILDLDDIKTEIAGVREHSLDETLVGPAIRVRNERLSRLSGRCSWRAAWFIVGEPKARGRDWWRAKLQPASVAVLETPLEECRRRNAADPSRAGRVGSMNALSQSWWTNYTRSPFDRIVKPGRASTPDWGSFGVV